MNGVIVLSKSGPFIHPASTDQILSDFFAPFWSEPAPEENM